MGRRDPYRAVSRGRSRRRAALLAGGLVAAGLAAWVIRGDSRRGPSPESDLDLPALFAFPHETPNASAPEDTRGIPVLCYHYFRPGLTPERILRVLAAVLLNMPTLPDKDFWSVTEPELERQMRFLAEEGFHTASLEELAAYRAGRIDLPERTVVLTVDDGDESFFTIAAPILRRYGHRATVFMLTGHAGDRNWNDIDFMTWDQLRALESSGVARIESHTHRMHTKVREGHGLVPRFLVECRDGTGAVSAASPLGRDLRASRDAIAHELGRESTSLSWPFGFGDADTDSLAAALGFRSIYTLRQARSLAGVDSSAIDDSGDAPRRTIGRYAITARTTLRAFRRLLVPEVP